METNTNHQHLLQYYEAFETLLEKSRQIGEFRTHFGIMDDAAEDYCFFKAIARPDVYQEMTKAAQLAMDKLHVEIFGKEERKNCNILDIGFGSGGTIKRLAEQWPESVVEGINLNPAQYKIANNYLSKNSNVWLHFGDVLQYDFKEKYNLVYFIESAFHILNKNALVAKLNQICAENGEVYIIDIFYTEPLWKRVEKAQKNEDEIFDYLSINAWKDLFNPYDFEFTGFDDLTKPVSKHITVNTPVETFIDEFLTPLHQGTQHTERLIEAHQGYSKLQKLLQKEMLLYGILRFKRKG
ncbi:MAG: methyltransferase domain-containing protein [Sphingobacteriales bacterium]|nr:MAG: methyltransferase domain-containing protein [Sphingobacteriales bacterium]